MPAVAAASQNMGLALHLATAQDIQELDTLHEDHFVWLTEILAAAKSTFISTPEITLLPKTPSAKRTRKGGRKKKAVTDEEEEYSSEASVSTSGRVTRNKAKKTTDDKPRSLRCTRNNPNPGSVSFSETESPDVRACENGSNNTPILSREDQESKARKSTPILKLERVDESKEWSAQKPRFNGSPRVIPGFDKLNVKAKAFAYEHIAQSFSDSDSEHTPRARASQRLNVQSQNTPRTADGSVPQTPPTLVHKAQVKLTLSASKKQAKSPATPRTIKQKLSTSVLVIDGNSSYLGESMDRRHTRSNRRSSTSRRSAGPRQSLSKRRSSAVKQKIRSSMSRRSSAAARRSLRRSGADKEVIINNADAESDNEVLMKSENEAEDSDGEVKMEKKAECVPEREADDDEPMDEEADQKPGHDDLDLQPIIEEANTASENDQVEVVEMKQKPERKVDDIEAENKTGKSKLKLTKKPTPYDPSIESQNASTPEYPEMRSTRSKMRVKPATSASSTSGDSDSDHHKQPIRSTRSKMRVNKEPLTLASCSSGNDESSPEKSMARSTRSKMRVKKTESATSSEEESRGGYGSPVRQQPFRSTRSKMRHVKTASSEEEDPATPTPQTDGFTHAVKSVTRAKIQKLYQNSPDMSTPEQRGLNGGATPAKQRRLSPAYAATPKTPKHDHSADHSSDEFIEKSPSPDCPREKVIRPLHPASFLTQLKKKNDQANLSINGLVTSFIQRNTPLKTTSQDMRNQRKRQVEENMKKQEQRVNKVNEDRLKRAEEIRKRNEERQKLAAKRREIQQKHQQEAKRDMNMKMEGKMQSCSKREEKIREEQERQRMLREKKMAEAEERRKQEEDARLKRLQKQEEEQRRYEEMMARKREFEEQERQRKAVEEKRRQEERLAELERERQRERDRLREEQQQREREERERQRQKEERDKREKAERERAEIERQKEKERLRQEQLEKDRELELQRVRDEAAREQARRDEEKKLRAVIDKHNSSVNKEDTGKTLRVVLGNNTSLNAAKPPAAATTVKLNTTVSKEKPVTKESNPDSYDMTPKRKHKPPSDSNYDIVDLCSDDSTDDEDAPRKKIPQWAQGASLKAALIHQHYNPPNLDNIFDTILMPELNDIFIKKKARFNKRTSSAIWTSPILKPSIMPGSSYGSK